MFSKGKGCRPIGYVSCTRIYAGIPSWVAGAIVDKRNVNHITDSGNLLHFGLFGPKHRLARFVEACRLKPRYFSVLEKCCYD